jgi:predicted transposase YbfD/YdcC
MMPMNRVVLHLIVNQRRFLIVPSVNVPHLASHVLAQMTAQLAADWQAAYSYRPVLVESFVELGRYRGTCYQAANWQALAVERTRLDTTELDTKADLRIGLYATSLTLDQYGDAQTLEIIRDHWSAIENGTHHRRDVTLGEDACRTEHRQGAALLASLRNLANGVFEMERERGRTKVDTLRSWCQQQTFSTVWPILQR